MEISQIRVILDPGNKGWILEKIALRLISQFENLGIKSDTASLPLAGSEINFWMQYTDDTIPNFARQNQTNCFALVTHVDDCFKLARVKLLFDLGVTLIFMSKVHADEVSEMLGLNQHFDFSLIPSDFGYIARPFRIGMVSKCYPDGRKNEDWLIKLAREGVLNDCEFVVMGEGWGSTIAILRSLGIKCQEFSEAQGNVIPYSEIKSFYNDLDLYVYFGFDEGALGSLDAYLLRKDLLVSDQGFHTLFNINNSSKFSNYEDAKQKLKKKIDEYNSWLESTYPWTWDYYASDILKIFHKNKNLRKSNPNRSNRVITNLDLFIHSFAYRSLLIFSLKRLLLVRLVVKIKKVFWKLK